MRETAYVRPGGATHPWMEQGLRRFILDKATQEPSAHPIATIGHALSVARIKAE